MEGGRDGEKEGQERGPSVQGGGLNDGNAGGGRGFAPELFVLLLEPRFINGVGLCDGQQTAKTKSTFI